MHAVDTNVLVWLIARDDPRQTSLTDAFIERGAWVSILALTEAPWVLATVYERTAKEIATAIEMLLSHKTLVLQDSEMIAKALNLFREHPALGFSDCLTLQLAKRAGHLPLGTFDRALAKLEGAQKL